MTGRQSCQETAAGVRKAVGRCMHCSRIVRTEWDENQSSNVEEIKTVVRLLDEWLADPNDMTIADAVGLANDFIADDIRDRRAEEEAGDRGAWLEIEIDEETAAGFREKISIGDLRRYARLQIEKERKSLLDHLNAVPGKHRGRNPTPG